MQVTKIQRVYLGLLALPVTESLTGLWLHITGETTPGVTQVLDQDKGQKMWVQGVGKIEKLASIFLARAVLAGTGLRTTFQRRPFAINSKIRLRWIHLPDKQGSHCQAAGSVALSLAILLTLLGHFVSGAALHSAQSPLTGSESHLLPRHWAI